MEGNDIIQSYLFYPKNIKFIQGKTSWTEQEKHDLFELLMSFPLIFLLLSFLRLSNIEFWTELLLLLIFGVICFSTTFWFYLKFSRRRALTNNGRLLSGRIIDCRLMNKGSETDIFEVRFIVEDSMCSFEICFDKKAVGTLTRRELYILYQDSEHFLVL